jgi:hypothetical protein
MPKHYQNLFTSVVVAAPPYLGIPLDKRDEGERYGRPEHHHWLGKLGVRRSARCTWAGWGWPR